MSKRALQVLTAVLGAVPILTGLVGLLGLGDPIYAGAEIPANALLDSNLRFLSGVWLGLGLTVIWLIPRIETQTVLFRVLWGMIFLGGVGRLLSMIFVGWTPIPFIAFTVLEIVGAPIFVAWQARLGK
jgi:hypothetical protein